MSAGYPVFITQTPGFSAGFFKTGRKRMHELSLSALLPSQISSDNGTGINYIINEKTSLYSRSSLNYDLWMHLIRRERFSTYYGISTGLLHEFRRLSYKSGVIENANDISLYLGPELKVNYCPLPRCITEGIFNARFHIPWLNYGVKNKTCPEESDSYTSHYRSLIYETIFTLKAGYRISRKYSISLVYMKQDLVGYGSHTASFHSRSVIHYKLDRIHRFQIQTKIIL
jgi:hypothetical protein